MRQGQPQNRQRSRGRNNNRNNNNRNSNNLNRSMESNGPDVRIRGTASNIAEKYQQLARDSHSAGDIVAAESYWQHAEHYNRLIAINQAAQNQAREEQRAQQIANGESGENTERPDEDGSDNETRGRGRGRGRNSRNRSSSDREASGETADTNASENLNGSGPQPTISDVPAEVALAEKPVVEPEAEKAPASKPRKSRRPRKETSEDVSAATAAENKPELPAFISGGAEE